MEAVPSPPPDSHDLLEAIRQQGPALEASPFPVAYLDFSGRFLYATADFPRPIDEGPMLEGRAIWDWISPEQHAAARAYFAACHEGLVAGGATPDGPVSRVAEPSSLPLACALHPGVQLLLYPLRGRGRPQGVLAVALPEANRMMDAEALEKREIRYRRRLKAVLDASREVSSSLDRDVILQNIVKRVRDLVAVPEAVLFLVNEDGETLSPVVAHVDSFLDEVMALRLTKGEGIVGWVAQTGKSEIVNHAERDPRSLQVPGTPVEPTSLLCAPLVIKDRVVGVLALSRLGGDNDFENEDLELSTIFAGHCSAAIENARLYTELRGTIEELRATQNQLVQSAKLNALGEMAGGVAHDFNNILAAILGRTQLLLRSANTKEVKDSLLVIEQTALDGAHTVKRIQEFTRVRHDESRESVNLNQVLLQVIDLTRSAWQAEAKAHGVHIQVATDLECGQPVNGSAAELREVFTNIVLNAVDALPQGGTLTLTTRDEGDRVVARVSDDGVGMDRETQARAFDPFFTTKRERGNGLGLSVAYGILRRHRAEIRVESELGLGTAFVIDFPAGAEADSAPPAPEKIPEAKPMKVLCVDDEPAVLDVLCELVEALGHDVVRARGGGEAIELARLRHPDVVLSDLGMPDVNGWEVAARVKRASPQTPVALVTGWGVQIEPEQARRQGVDLILPKPFTVDEINKVLLEASELRDARRVA
ncbi:MAG TPA: GAF domain-containing protein [Candidatus Eisenbacteria bacterium]|jgi:signal transduction histidine kinase/CheY-like chemotaxis protein|nr:GAF domain-containing protein [Candidatus Eisenbacteria bacterium]